MDRRRAWWLPRVLLPVLVAGGLLGVVLAATLARGGGDDEPVVVVVDPQAPSVILADWDERRASAWAAGDVEALRSLYIAGSGAGTADAAMLDRYVERGLVVDSMTRQVLSVEVREREPERLVLEVIDRLAGGTVLPAGGGATGWDPRGESAEAGAEAEAGTPLPGAHVATRVIELALGPDDEWLVTEVHPAE